MRFVSHIQLVVESSQAKYMNSKIQISGGKICNAPNLGRVTQREKKSPKNSTA